MRLFIYNVTLLVLLAAGSITMWFTHAITTDAFWICACIEALIGVTLSNAERDRKDGMLNKRPFDPFRWQKPVSCKSFTGSTLKPSLPFQKRAFQLCMLPFAIVVFILLLPVALLAYLVTGHSYLNRILDLTDNLTLNLLTR